MALIKKEMKIFDMNNPNCKFTNKPSPYMFYNKPLISYRGRYEERVVGIIPDGADIEERKDGFYTEVVFWWNVDSCLDFKNYEVQGDIIDYSDDIPTFEISNIFSIHVG